MAESEDQSPEERLLISARNGNVEIVEDLLKEKQNGLLTLDINCWGNQKSNKGWTPIHLASYFGHEKVIHLLLENGASVNVVNDVGDTPLHRAAHTGRTDCVILLLKYGANVKMVNSEGSTPKMLAVNQSIREILEAAEKTDKKRLEDELLRCVRQGDSPKVQELLYRNDELSINCTDTYGNTPLHHAAKQGYRYLALLLLENGANPKTNNCSGLTPVEIASDRQMQELLSVQPIAQLQSTPIRMEGYLSRRKKVLGWTSCYAVVDSGMLTFYKSKMEATVGKSRSGQKLLAGAKIDSPVNDKNVFVLSCANRNIYWLSVDQSEADPETATVLKQKWITALQKHIKFATDLKKHFSQSMAEEDWENTNDVMPMGSLQDALQSAEAYQDVLQKHGTTLTTSITLIQEKDDPSVVDLIKVRQEMRNILECSESMTSSLRHCLDVFMQQDQLQKHQLERLKSENQKLQEALDLIATIHSSQGDMASQNCQSSDPEEDEFYDCDDKRDPTVGFTLGTTSTSSQDLFAENANGSNNNSLEQRKSTPEHPADRRARSRRNESSNMSKWGGRRVLPAKMFSRKDFSVWTFLKQCIGKELSKITMPIVFNEPLSFLQRITEYMEYSHLLSLASDCDDLVSRMEYVTAFAVSSAASNWERLGKPFNPLLGETYELDREDLGFKICCEQVSHHPPISAFHVESPKFTFHGTIYPKLRFWGKSVEVTPKGMLTLHLHEHHEVYTWQNIDCCVHNVIVGKLWIEHYGTMEIINHSSRHKSVVNFKPCGWFGRDLHKIEGYLYDKNKKKLRAFYGKWIDALYSYDVSVYEAWVSSKQPVPSEEITVPPPSSDENADDPPPVRASTCDLRLQDQKLLWIADPRIDESSEYYNFTLFAMMLNELMPGQEKIISPTDSRLRPDMRLMEQGNLDAASAEKHRLEEKQRASRKDRKKSSLDWQPLWFKERYNQYTGKEEWMFTGDYWKRQWKSCPDIF